MVAIFHLGIYLLHLFRAVKRPELGRPCKQCLRSIEFYQPTTLQQSHTIKPFNVSETMHDRNDRLRSKISLNNVLHDGFRIPVHTVTHTNDISIGINSFMGLTYLLVASSRMRIELLVTIARARARSCRSPMDQSDNDSSWSSSPPPEEVPQTFFQRPTVSRA